MTIKSLYFYVQSRPRVLVDLHTHFSETLIRVDQYDPSYPLCRLSNNTLCNSVVTHTLDVSVSKHLLKFNKQAYTRTDVTFKFSYLPIEAIFFRLNFRWLCLVFRVLDSISAGEIIDSVI